MNRTQGAGLIVCVYLLLGCRPDPILIELEFPSTDTFLYSEIGQLTVFELLPTELGECPRLVEEILAGSTTNPPILDTGNRSICGFCNGGVAYEDIEEGPRAFVMVVRDAANTPILSGCTVGEIFENAPTIKINLFMTSLYSGIAEAGPPQFADPIRKCGGECQ